MLSQNNSSNTLMYFSRLLRNIRNTDLTPLDSINFQLLNNIYQAFTLHSSQCIIYLCKKLLVSIFQYCPSLLIPLINIVLKSEILWHKIEIFHSSIIVSIIYLSEIIGSCFIINQIPLIYCNIISEIYYSRFSIMSLYFSEILFSKNKYYALLLWHSLVSFIGKLFKSFLKYNKLLVIYNKDIKNIYSQLLYFVLRKLISSNFLLELIDMFENFSFLKLINSVISSNLFHPCIKVVKLFILDLVPYLKINFNHANMDFNCRDTMKNMDLRNITQIKISELIGGLIHHSFDLSTLMFGNFGISKHLKILLDIFLYIFNHRSNIFFSKLPPFSLSTSSARFYNVLCEDDVYLRIFIDLLVKIYHSLFHSRFLCTSSLECQKFFLNSFKNSD